MTILAATFLAALALSGCATTKYVTRSCITPAQLAEIEARAPPKVRDQLNGNAEHDVKILAATISIQSSWDAGLPLAGVGAENMP